MTDHHCSANPVLQAFNSTVAPPLLIRLCDMPRDR